MKWRDFFQVVTCHYRFWRQFWWKSHGHPQKNWPVAPKFEWKSLQSHMSHSCRDGHTLKRVWRVGRTPMCFHSAHSDWQVFSSYGLENILGFQILREVIHTIMLHNDDMVCMMVVTASRHWCWSISAQSHTTTPHMVIGTIRIKILRAPKPNLMIS